MGPCSCLHPSSSTLQGNQHWKQQQLAFYGEDETRVFWPLASHMWSTLPRRDLCESPVPAHPYETPTLPAYHAGQVRYGQAFGQYELDSQLNHLLLMKAFLHVTVTSAMPGRAREEAPTRAICISAEDKSCLHLYGSSTAKTHLLLEGCESLRREHFSFTEEPKYY